MNLTWSCKWIICKRITEHTCWSVRMQLTCHIKFCTCDGITPKYWCVGARATAIAHHSLTGLLIVNCFGIGGITVECFMLIGHLVYASWNYLKYNTIMYLTMITAAATLPHASALWHAEFGIYTSKYLPGISPR